MREAIRTDGAPAAIGPYSQAVRAGGLLFCSGQIPIDPATGELVSGSIGEETRRVMQNLKALIEAGGATMASVVKCSIFLTDMGDFSAVNEAYGAYFSAADPPARACVEVSGLPKGVRVEIEAIALVEG